jgi:septal ring factor EnvC (AmiA/AmiB activator)
MQIVIAAKEREIATLRAELNNARTLTEATRQDLVKARAERDNLRAELSSKGKLIFKCGRCGVERKAGYSGHDADVTYAGITCGRCCEVEDEEKFTNQRKVEKMQKDLDKSEAERAKLLAILCDYPKGADPGVWIARRDAAIGAR